MSLPWRYRGGYNFAQQGAVIPGNSKIEEIQLTYKDGTIKVAQDKLVGELAKDVRNHLVSSIQIQIN